MKEIPYGSFIITKEGKAYVCNSCYEHKDTEGNFFGFDSYILKESKAPEHFDATTNEYPVEVAYGVTTGGPSNGIVENTLSVAKIPNINAIINMRVMFMVNIITSVDKYLGKSSTI